MTLEIFEIVLISTIAFLVILGVTVIATNSAPRRVFFMYFPRRGVFFFQETKS